MSAELESELRTALHERADRITFDQLRHADRPAPGGARRVPALAAIVAAALVVAIALGVTLLGVGHNHNTATTRRLVGSQWTLVHVHDAHGDVDIPRSSRGSISFSRHFVSVDDGCNSPTGRYRISADRLILIGPFWATMIGCPIVRGDRVRREVKDGVDALIGRTSRSNSPLGIGVSGDRLTLTRGNLILIFTYAGRGVTDPSSGPTHS